MWLQHRATCIQKTLILSSVKKFSKFLFIIDDVFVAESDMFQFGLLTLGGQNERMRGA